MRIRRSAALAATLVLVTVPAVFTTASAGGGASDAARQRAEHNRILSHWTEARMRAAVPRDFAYDSARGFHLVPKAKPGGGGTGASWPNGLGLVYKATGKVFFDMGGGSWVCSGTALSDSRSTFSLVITAGHCAYDETADGAMSGFATNWMFIPQFDSNPTFSCGSTAFGCWTAQALVVNDGFASAGSFNDQATRYDWAFAVVGAGGKTNAQLDATVGTFSHSATSAMTSGTTVYAFGYPAAQKYHGNDLVYCNGGIGFDALNNNDTYKLACGMTGGSSGGPWFSGFNATTGSSGTIRSLNSYGYSGQANMYGPKFNTTTSATYNAANSATSNTIVP